MTRAAFKSSLERTEQVGATLARKPCHLRVSSAQHDRPPGVGHPAPHRAFFRSAAYTRTHCGWQASTQVPVLHAEAHLSARPKRT